MPLPPLLLLDVDGVVNSFPAPRARFAAGFEQTTADADGIRYPIHYRPALVQRLNDWHRRGVVEIRWLTTWHEHAARSLAPALGFEEFAVVPRPSGVPTGDDPDAVAGSVPWWKLTAVLQLADQEQGRRLVWIDDLLRRPLRDLVEAAFPGRTLLVAPQSSPGLTDADLTGIEGWLALHD